MPNPSDRERIDDLESRLTYQDDALNQLSDVLAELQQRIKLLETTVERLIEQLNEAREDATPDEEPPPPHY